MSNILLFIIAAAAPWVVHLAPPRQRAFALVLTVAVLMFYGVFARNPLTAWQLWAGLVVGLLSVMLVAGFGQRQAASVRAPRSERSRSRSRRPRLDEANQPTGEI